MNGHQAGALRVQVVAVTKRPVFTQLLQEHRIPAYWAILERAFPSIECGDPLLIDVNTFQRLELARVLAQLEPLAGALPVVALVDPANVGAIRLLALCPAVTVFVGDPQSMITYLKAVRPLPKYVWQRAWLLPSPAMPVADPHFLRIVAALADGPTMEVAAERLHMGRRTLYRRIRDYRQCLGLVVADLARLSPLENAEALIAGYYGEGGESSKECGT